MHLSAESSSSVLEHTGFVITDTVFCGCCLNEFNCPRLLFLNCYKLLSLQACDLCIHTRGTLPLEGFSGCCDRLSVSGTLSSCDGL